MDLDEKERAARSEIHFCAIFAQSQHIDVYVIDGKMSKRAILTNRKARSL
jgi:hypothetical protein